MKQWNPKLPGNKPLVDFLKNAQVLLVDLGSGSRSSIRRLLKELDVKIANVQTEETLDGAAARIETQKPQVVFLDANQAFGAATVEWISRFAGAPIPSPRVLTLITANQTPAMASQLAELEVDTFLSLPFTYQDVFERFLDALTAKVAPTPYQRLLEEGKELLLRKKPDEARSKFEQAKKIGQEPSLACALQARSFESEGRPDDALASYAEGLRTNPTHYKCLAGALEIHLAKQETALAYEYAQKLSNHHPLNPRRLPEFIRLSVYNGHFPDVLDFYQFVVQADLKDELVIRSVAAGMVVCAKYFLKKGDPAKALDTFRKAERLAPPFPVIHKEIILSLLRAKLDREADDFLRRAGTEIQDCAEVALATIERWKGVKERDGFVLQTALDWIRKGSKEPRFFALAIEKSTALQRKPEQIQELKDQAARLSGQSVPSSGP